MCSCHHRYGSSVTPNAKPSRMRRASPPRSAPHLDQMQDHLVAQVAGGVTLTADDWELDAATGELWRLDGADRRVAWPAAKIVVAYAAGYLLPGDPQRDLPEDLERACLETVKARWFARLRDPLIKGEQVQGIASADYWVPSTGDADPGLPPSVVGLLQRYRLPTV